MAAVAGGACRGADETADLPRLEGPYLGQPPPGEVPEIFAPGLVSDVFAEHSGLVMTPEGDEIFWTTAINEGREPRIVTVLHMKRVGGVWTPPEVALFCRGRYTHVNSISPDGRRLYFFSEEGGDSGGTWVVDRTAGGWGEPRFLLVNGSDQPGRHVNEVNEAHGGNLYLSGPCESLPGGRGIVRTRYEKGGYRDYESLGPHVNLPHSDWFPNHSPYVDPDEGFVLFASTRPGGHGEQDLYVSFRGADDSFGPAVNLGPRINGVADRLSWPRLSPDGRYLFFVGTVHPYRDLAVRHYTYAELKEVQEGIHNGWSNLYWVDAGFIEGLRPAG